MHQGCRQPVRVAARGKRHLLAIGAPRRAVGSLECTGVRLPGRAVQDVASGKRTQLTAGHLAVGCCSECGK